ncbi:MAG: glycine--tRNA ligase subunit beta [Thermodesulfovibrionales bacterium]|nr:glycine--tRNA ligase subunit beta [Thermodesulfovibrionales bacterium]
MENNRDDKTQNNVAKLLLELGVEEIPARFLPDALVALKNNAEKLFTENRLIFSNIKTHATPRRITLIADLEKHQKVEEKEIWGPPVNVAFDDFGNPTKAAEAFAKTHGITLDSLQKKEKGKGLYIVAIVKEEANKTKDVLPQILSRLILSLNFPKNMRWGDGDLKFVRPIHWILAIYDQDKIAFEIEGIRSDSMTRGHRFLSPASFEIKDIKSYTNLLRNNFVIVNQEERKKIIIEESNKLAQSVNASVIIDEDLLEHVTFLVEYPVPVLGSFPSEYLSLPPELLINVMKGHQKYFALEDANKRLVNYFIIVSNTKLANSDTVRKGAERVIKARFEDARFYFEEDTKIPLESRIEDLKKVIYHDKLGSLYSKTQRIVSIAEFVANKCCPSKIENIVKAANLSKTDLITGVVREFPELQGIIGSYYAAKEGYNDSICKALREQYLPAHASDILPVTDTGSIVSLSDKLDNIASFFMIGLSPTGSEDPFALRRQAHGVILILVAKKYDLTLKELIEVSLKPYDISDKEELISSLIKFFEQRFDYLMQLEGYPSDYVSSVIHFLSNTPLYKIKNRLQTIYEFKNEPNFESLILSIKRVNNIAPKFDVPKVTKELFVNPEEEALYNALLTTKDQVTSSLAKNDYLSALKAIKNLTEPINSFFDKVLVMDKNEEIKNNRLALIKDVQTLIQSIADFSKLT